MPQIILLIDFENVRDVALASLPSDYRVFIFVGRSQNSIPFKITREAQQLGSRLEWIKIEGDGRNNLDFHLCFHLGVLSKEHPHASFVIVSRDKGFDALLKHVLQKGIQCRRIGDFSDVAAAPTEPGDPHFTRAYEVLAKIEKKSRPRRRKTLLQQIGSIFQKKLTEAEIQRIVDQLITKGLIAETDNALTYHF